MTSGRHANAEWMRPPQYNDTRFKEPAQAKDISDAEDIPEERTAKEIDELINRAERPRGEPRNELPGQSTDTAPLDYTKGEHDEEFGVDEDAPGDVENPELNYDRGPHEEVFDDEDDEEEFERLDADPEFDEEA